MSLKLPFRFAIASDGHYGEPGVESDKNYINLINWLKEEKEKNGLDLWFFNGDLVHDAAAFLPMIKSYFDMVQVPYFAIKGNHDTINNTLWKKIFGHEANFEFVLHDMAFIAAITSDDDGNYLCADTFWLEEKIKGNLNCRYIFIFLHLSQGGLTRHGIYCPEVIELFDKYPQITAVFHGHDHQDDHLRKSKNTHFFFDGYIGGSWGPNYFGYRIVERKDNPKIRTYQFNPIENRIINENYI